MHKICFAFYNMPMLRQPQTSHEIKMFPCKMKAKKKQI